MTNINDLNIENKKPLLEELIKLEKDKFYSYNKRKRGELCEFYVRYWLNQISEFKQIDLKEEDFKDYFIKKSNLGGIKVYDKLDQRDYELDGIFYFDKNYYILEVKSGSIKESSKKQFDKLNKLGSKLFKSNYGGLIVFANLEKNLEEELVFDYDINLFDFKITNQMIKKTINLL